MCLEMTVFTLQCVWRLMFPWFFLFCKLVSVSLQTTAVMWPRALTDSLRLCCSSNSSQYFHTSPQTTLPCTHQSHSSSLVAPFCSLFHFYFLSSLSLRRFVSRLPPPTFSPSLPLHEASVLCFLELKLRGLSVLLSDWLSGNHMVGRSGLPLLLCPPSSLGVPME